MKYRLICLLLLSIPFWGVLLSNGSVKEAGETQVMAILPFLFSLRTFITALKNPSKQTCIDFAKNWLVAVGVFLLIGIIVLISATSNVAF